MTTALQLFLRAPGQSAPTGVLESEHRYEVLKERFGIRMKRHPKYPNLVHFKYSQIDSPMSEQIVRECRGIILDEDDNWAVVSRAFDKFFNYGDGHAAKIDWSTASVQEKCDGSLCVVYPYAGKWHVATTGTPDGGGPVNDRGYTFADYFWDTLENRYGNPFARMDANIWPACFYFELMGPDNRVVIPHEEPDVVLLGARDVTPIFGGEIIPYDAMTYLMRHLREEIPIARSYALKSFEDIAKTFETMSPLTQEGYVVCDANFNRVKVKHPGYVALHHAKDGLTEKAFIEICRKGETCEVLAAFPEFRPMMERIQSQLDTYVLELEKDYERIKHIPVQKNFALEAVKTRNPAALFQLRAGRVQSIRDYVAEMRIENLQEGLNGVSGALGEKVSA
jgi:hypothetical protein